MDTFESRLHYAVRTAIKESSGQSYEQEVKNNQAQVRARSIERAKQLTVIVPAKLARATEVSDGHISTMGPISIGHDNFAYDINWTGSIPERKLRIAIDCSIGIIDWQWLAHGTSAGSRVIARDISDGLLESLIFALVDPTLWEQGRFPVPSL